MSTTPEPSLIDPREQEERAIQEALLGAFRDAVREHRNADQPLVIWEHGHVVLVPPQEFQTV